GKDLKGSTIYTTLFPCNECAKAIIQAGIRHVVYLSDKYAETDATIASKRMFDMAGVTYHEYNLHGKTLELNL
ncbi:MAG: cytidine deaminase, partial [Massilioclostridium sp.]